MNAAPRRPAALDWVLDYIAAGVAVLPCRGKVPLTRHGKDDATLDPGQVAEWAARWPGCNWGGRPPEGIVVLDVDPRNGGGTELLQLRERHGQLPATLTARTGGGGLHIWLAYRGPAPGKLGPGLDVKTCRGYVLLPPSIHPDTGRPYEWIDPDATTAPAPAWLRRLLAPPQPPAPRAPQTTSDRKLAGLVRTVADAPEGTRNQRLYWAARRAAEAALDTAPLIEAAVSAGLTTTEAARTVASAARQASS